MSCRKTDLTLNLPLKSFRKTVARCCGWYPPVGRPHSRGWTPAPRAKDKTWPRAINQFRDKEREKTLRGGCAL